MSPFELVPGHWVSCLSAGGDHPVEHARTCACPCPACITMIRALLEDVGLLDPALPPRHVFVFALGRLAVSSELGPEDDDVSVLYGGYLHLGQETGKHEAVPLATFGWLVPDGDTLVAVRAPNDPWADEATAALAGWAASHGLELRTPLEAGGLFGDLSA